MVHWTEAIERRRAELAAAEAQRKAEQAERERVCEVENSQVRQKARVAIERLYGLDLGEDWRVEASICGVDSHGASLYAIDLEFVGTNDKIRFCRCITKDGDDMFFNLETIQDDEYTGYLATIQDDEYTGYHFNIDEILDAMISIIPYLDGEEYEDDPPEAPHIFWEGCDE